MKEKIAPPKFAEWILKKSAFTFEETSLLGDFEEEFRRRARERSPLQAAIWYWWQTGTSLYPFLKNSFYWSLVMIWSYLKTAFRSFKRHKAYSFINIAGLAMGITCCVFMLIWVQDELSFDRFHTHAKEIHRILLDPQGASPTHEAVSPPVLAKTMLEEIPGVINTTRITGPGSILFSTKDKTLFENRGILADPSFFDIFDFPIIKGDASSALKELRSIVLSEKLAEKYFGSGDPLGQTITLGGKNDYTVTGVIQNVPSNSHLQFDYVRPFELLAANGRNLESWGDVSYYTYVLLQKGTSIQSVNDNLKTIIQKNDPSHNLYYLQPLTQIHLHSKFNFDIGTHGNITYVYIFAAAAFFVLLIACINYMNLATARSGIRAKEIGMRKVIGARKADIVKQFYGESLLSTLLVFVLAVLFILLLVPVFSQLSGKELTFGLTNNKELLLGLLALAVFTGLFSGSYPALILSNFQPVKVFRDSFKSGPKGSLFRKILVVTQFSLTIMLIAGTVVISRQLSYMRKLNLGYDKEQIVTIPLRGIDSEVYTTFKDALLRQAGIVNVTTTSSLPTFIGSGTSGAEWEGKDPEVRIQMQINSVDYDYLDTFKMEMAQGRFFSRDFPSDQTGFVLNETAIKAMGLKDPLGKRFKTLYDGRIIGVVKDFHYKSLHTEIEPLILLMLPDYISYACIRIQMENVSNTLAFIETTWKKYIHDVPFQFSFLDDRIDDLYTAEERMGQVFRYFTFFGMFIACLGLFGMASFTTERRTKEIGIRKILGASASHVVTLLTKEFTKLIVLSNLIAWPVAYFIMNRWLQSFAYRTKMGIGIFLFSSALALVIALMTVSLQSIKAALANPSEALRHE